jgi:site-specific DNA-methyltransferase (adenine-specific)
MTANPFADLLPPLAEEEFAALEADIKVNGVQDPVWEDENGKVLDGNHRLLIDPNAPRRRVPPGMTDAEKEAFVFRCNFNRRNLSPEQKSETRRKMKATAFRLRAGDKKKWTQAAIARALGVTRQCVEKWFNREATPNATSSNGSKADARVKLDSDQKQEVVRRVSAGESQAQVAADYGVAQQHVSRLVGRAAREEEGRARCAARDAQPLPKGADVRLFPCRFQDLERVASLKPASVNLLLTDPPYNGAFLDQWNDLGALAARLLVEGGLLVTYSGHAYLPRVLAALGEHLTYRWSLASVWDGGANLFHSLQALSKWKPILVFSKGPWQRRGMWPDVLRVNGQEKGLHDWQQPLLEAEALLSYFSRPGDLVVDTCAGSGTVPLACARQGRRCVGADCDAAALATAQARVLGARAG